MSIDLTIQTLGGKTFQVTLEIEKANKIYREGGALNDLYALDYLKLEITKINGVDPIRQQLIAENPLTIKTSLQALANTTIQLLIIAPLKLNIIKENLFGQHHYSINIQMWYPHQKLSGTDLMFSFNHCGCICYFQSNSRTYAHLPEIEVVGYDSCRGFLKIEIERLPQDNLKKLTISNGDDKYTINPSDPKYGWLRYDERTMDLI